MGQILDLVKTMFALWLKKQSNSVLEYMIIVSVKQKWGKFEFFINLILVSFPVSLASQSNFCSSIQNNMISICLLSNKYIRYIKTSYTVCRYMKFYLLIAMLPTYLPATCQNQSPTQKMHDVLQYASSILWICINRICNDWWKLQVMG